MAEDVLTEIPEESMKKVKEQLANFVCSDELANLEDMVNSNFNIFLALGMGNLEIKHSNFLAWLFDPKEKHGMGDFFVKNFLKLTMKDSLNSGISDQLTLFDVNRMNFSNLTVKREWKNIDILLEDNINKFVCVIENKIKACQGSGQLKRYFDQITDDYSDYKKLFLYLKPINDEELIEPYQYVSYNTVLEVLNKILNKKSIILNNEIEICVRHYKDLLEARVMDNKIKNLCMEVYSAHKDAINLLIDNIDFSVAQTKIAEIIRNTIKEDGNFKLYPKGGSRNIYFVPTNFDGSEDFHFAVSNPAGINGNYDFKIWIDGKGCKNIRKQLKDNSFKYKINCPNFEAKCEAIENGDANVLVDIEKAFLEKLEELKKVF